MKGQDRAPENQLNEVEIGSVLEKELRILIVKMIQYLGKRTEAKIEKMQEMFTKDLEELKNRDTLEGINSRITEAEERINDMENRMVEITATQQNTEKRMKRNEDMLRNPLGQHQIHQHSHYRGPRKRRERERT